MLDLCARVTQPEEISAGDRLIDAVDTQRVVRAGATEIVPPAFLRVIREGTRIDQELRAACAQRECKRVSVAMRGDREIAQRPCVRDDAKLAIGLEAIPENVVATC